MNDPKSNVSTARSDLKPSAQAMLDLETMEGIPVYELRFAVGMNNKPDIPIFNATGGMGALRGNDGTEITYLPKMQLYRVVQKSRDPKTMRRLFYVPREWAAFIPNDGQKL